jgi:hypothetical protein
VLKKMCLHAPMFVYQAMDHLDSSCHRVGCVNDQGGNRGLQAIQGRQGGQWDGFMGMMVRCVFQGPK